MTTTAIYQSCPHVSTLATVGVGSFPLTRVLCVLLHEDDGIVVCGIVNPRGACRVAEQGLM